MTLASKRGILLFVATVLLAAATWAPPAPRLLATCPSLRCPNRTILTCTTTPCSALDNCGIICAGRVVRCTGTCIIE